MSKKVFGVDLESLVTQQKVEIPKIVSHTMDYLHDKKAHLEEGLFRIPGNSIKIAQLKKQFDSDGSVDLFKQRDLDTHTAACLLKLYLRELPVPVILPRYYSTYLKVYQNPDHKQRLINFRKLITGLPKCNRTLMIAVLGYLRLVAQNQPVNKMSALNLALIFAPNLMRAERETLTSIMEDADKVAGTLQLLIQEVDYLETGAPPAWFESYESSALRSKAMSSPPMPRAVLQREETISISDTPEETNAKPAPTADLKSENTPPQPSVSTTNEQATSTDSVNNSSTTQNNTEHIPPLEAPPSEISNSTSDITIDSPLIASSPTNERNTLPGRGRQKSKRDIASSQEAFSLTSSDSGAKVPPAEAHIIRSCSDTSLDSYENINETEEQIIKRSVRNMKALRGSLDLTHGTTSSSFSPKSRRRLSLIGATLAKSQLLSYQNLKLNSSVGDGEAEGVGLENT